MLPWEIPGKVGEFDEDWRVTTLALLYIIEVNWVNSYNGCSAMTASQTLSVVIINIIINIIIIYLFVYVDC